MSAGDDLLKRAAEAPLAGALATTLAHEIAQPLSAIEMRLDTAQRLLRSGGDTEGALARIEQAMADLRHATDVVQRVRGLSRNRDWSFEPVDAARVATEALALVEPLAKSVTVERDLSAALPPVLGDAVMLRQVLVNVMRNGIEAMATSPIRTLRVSAESDRELGRTGRSVVIIRVSDTGAGMTAEASSRAGEAFFTTKRTGTGLGLSTSRTIAALHKGRLWHEPRPEGGTVFCLSVPTVSG